MDSGCSQFQHTLTAVAFLINVAFYNVVFMEFLTFKINTPVGESIYVYCDYYIGISSQIFTLHSVLFTRILAFSFS